MGKDILILGAGLSGISTAYFLQEFEWVDSITLLEKESRPGGLCRTIEKDGYLYDIGPHILFSKDKEMLELMLSVVDQKNTLKRSNKILYKQKQIQYPFENDLSKLPQEDLSYCINTFNHNPYENYEVANMIQFFLKTFGEGITNTYLRPYNEKIWKYDPAFMNTSMVDRIPKPTQEEIRRSASGETVEGYLHQLYFTYPANGGIEAVPKAFLKKLDSNKCAVHVNQIVCGIKKAGKRYIVRTADDNEYSANIVISTIPVQALTAAYEKVPDEIHSCIKELRYNSIAISFVQTPYDLCGENFTFMIPDKNILFHRISKMDFLGSAYHHGKEATYIVEITYRKNDSIDMLSEEQFRKKICSGMVNIGFAHQKEDVKIIDITKYEYAYVIYDLNHSANMEKIRDYYSQQNIFLNGRFGNFEYWNMDRILRASFELGKKLQAIYAL